MSDVASRVRQAGDALTPQWSPNQLDWMARATLRRARRRRAVRVTAMVVAFAGAAGGGAAWQLRVPAELTAVDDGIARVAIASGGEVRITGRSAVRTLRENAGETRLELPSGAARFTVDRQPNRRVRVAAGSVLIEAAGSVFVVERRAGDVRIAVEEGLVRVSGDGAEARAVRAGEAVIIDDVAAPRVEPADPPPIVPAARAPRAPKATPSRPDRGWRELAAAGSFDDAWSALQRSAPRDEPDDLLRAADVARLSGHPRQAVEKLERVVTRFPRDARAPLASFTLGRVWLEELGAPRDAATAFARARDLAPAGPLAADALAREVEALARAGDQHEARERARQYLARHPQGARTKAVADWAGLR